MIDAITKRDLRSVKRFLQDKGCSTALSFIIYYEPNVKKMSRLINVYKNGVLAAN